MDRLTPRQREIVILRCERGLTNKAVAAALNISMSTVKRHWMHVHQRLGVVSAPAACWLLGRSLPVPALRWENV